MLDIDASWTGIMGYSADHMPWVGSVPERAGVWLAAGYTGHGMPNAALCGSHLARLVLTDLDGGSFEEVQQGAVADESIPFQYVISKDRMERTAHIRA